MREALAAANHDFLLREDDPAPTERRGARRGRAGTGLLARLFGGRRRGLAFLALAGAAAIGVPLNALFLQDGRHPAPLFRAAEPPPAIVQAPPPPARPAAVIAAAPLARPAPIKAEPAHAPAEKPRDPIGALLAGETPRAASKAEDADSKNVLAAQRALMRLGYVIKPDGVLGAATRQALEAFARENGLPATGEPTPRLLRRLTARVAQSAR